SPMLRTRGRRKARRRDRTSAIAPRGCARAGGVYTSGMVDATPSPPRAAPNSAVTCGLLALAAVAILARLGGLAVARIPAPRPAIAVAPSPSLLVAARELSRVEALDLHFEKVIDLTETQSRLFGLVDATDAILLVAAVDVTMGVDLGKLRDDD